MGNFRYRMLQFMIGRNGFDAFLQRASFSCDDSDHSRYIYSRQNSQIYRPCYHVLFIFQGLFQEYRKTKRRKLLVYFLRGTSASILYAPGPQEL